MRFRAILLLCAMLIGGLSGAFGQNATDAKGRKQGPWSKAWPNGTLRYTGQFVDDMPVGVFRHFGEDGKLTTVQHHAGDGSVSRAEHFHANGQVMARGRYVGQSKDSTWSYFALDGSLRKVERYASGKLDGEQVTYYPGGQVAEREERKAGILEGPSMSWFPSGKVKSESHYRNGEPEGRMVFYYPSGNKEIEGQMINGDRDGTWYYYNSDGSIQVVMLYARGQLIKERKENGTFREYYDDEQLKREVTYRKGRREGPFAEYHANGRWVMKPVQPDPTMGAPADVERVLEGQTKRLEGTYVNDQLEGEVREYDERGRLVKTTRYAAGVAQP
ncbi:MAG: toxin-antitoxin system YwqK family antitoxin [Flavobacteriales bacterium]|nr:MAG: toxin-antitoxin system YwqK family antitoxin [Flavobacteriales bacterium]